MNDFVRLSFPCARSPVIAAAAVLAAPARRADVPAHATVPTPVPSPILPPVPSVAPGYEAPDVRADRGRHRRRHAAAVRRHRALGRDRHGAAEESESCRLGFEHARRALSNAASQGRFRRSLLRRAVVKHDTNAAAQRLFRGRHRLSADRAKLPDARSRRQGQTETGTQYNVGVSQTKVNDNTYINTFNPYYLGSFNVSVTQPLLKNFG